MVLGLVLLILLLVLFVPLRYNVKGRYHEQLKAKLSVSWLLKLIHVKAEAIQTQIRVRICVFGHAFKKMYLGNWGDEKKTGEEAGNDTKDTDGEQKADTSASDPKGKAAEPAVTEKKEEAAPPPAPEEPQAEKEQEQPPKEEKKKDRYDALFEKLEQKAAEKQAELDAVKARKEAAGKAKEKKRQEESAEPAPEAAEESEEGSFLKTASEWIEKISDFWDDEKNQDAVYLIEKQLLRLGKHLLPTRFQVEGELGLGDPAKTGQIIGKIYRFYPLYGEHIRLDGVYDEKRINIYTEVGGRIRLGVIVGAALRLLLNARIRRWIKQLKHRNDGEEDGEEKKTKRAGHKEKSQASAA